MTKEYLVTYIIDGIGKAEQVFAQNEYRAVDKIYDLENVSKAYVDMAIIRVDEWKNEGYRVVML